MNEIIEKGLQSLKVLLKLAAIPDGVATAQETDPNATRLMFEEVDALIKELEKEKAG